MKDSKAERIGTAGSDALNYVKNKMHCVKDDCICRALDAAVQAVKNCKDNISEAAERIKAIWHGGDKASQFWAMKQKKGEIQMPKERIYLAGMYSDPDPDVREQRTRRLSVAAGLLMKQGCLVFSPISHSAFIVDHVDGMPSSSEFWLEQCDSYLKHWTTKVLVLPNGDWWESVGVRHEVKLAKALHIPVEVAFPLMDAVLMHESGMLQSQFLIEHRLDSGEIFSYEDTSKEEK